MTDFWLRSTSPSRASSIISTNTRFSTSTTEDPLADTYSIDLVANGQHFHISRDGSRISTEAPPPYLATVPQESHTMASTSAMNEVRPDEIHPNSPEHAIEQLEIETPANNDEDANIVYPQGLKFWLSMSSLMLSLVFVGLDMTIVAVAVPSLTDHFKTIDDIGWYSSAYMLFNCCFVFLSAQLYTVFSLKKVYLVGIAIFQLGSLLCTIAPRSGIFILGRSIAGVGASTISIGGMVMISHIIPRHKRPLWQSLLQGVNSVAMVSAPLIGGALIDAFSWRACFGINIPFGVGAILLTTYAFENPVHNAATELPLRDKLRKMDLIGTAAFIPSIVCLLVALQWGGTRYGWNNPIIISLITIFALLLGVFAYIQYRAKESATLPPRILKQRTVIAGAWFCACCNGILAVTEYFIAIYFQGVRGFSASKSGALGLPLIVGLLVAGVLTGVLTTVIGYIYPFMLCTSILAPIAAGLLTTLDLDESLIKVLGILGFLGVAVGFGLGGPAMGVQNVLPTKDIAIGIAVTGFAGALGSSMFICASSALFQNRLREEIAQHATGVNATAFDNGGLSDIREYIGGNRLRNVLLGYDEAVSQTLYIPVALAVLTLIGSIAVERKSIKKKQN